MWTCPYCRADNPSDTLECERCERLDPNATGAEIAAWNAALRYEAEQHYKSIRLKRLRPPRWVAAVVAAILLGPIAWTAVDYAQAVSEARQFDHVASCDGPDGPSTPSPPCSGVLMAVSDGYSDGYAEVVPRRTVARRWTWLTFTVILADAEGNKRSVDVGDQTVLNTVTDEDKILAVEYRGKIVALSGPSGYFQTADNPDVVRRDRGSDLIRLAIFAILVGGVYALMEASGKWAVRAAREDTGR